METPDAASIVLEMISLNYSETLSAAAGESMELAKEQTIKECAGNFILVYEGSRARGLGAARRCAWPDKPGTEHLIEGPPRAAAGRGGARLVRGQRRLGWARIPTRRARSACRST